MEVKQLDISIKNVTENYKERIQRLALFDPLYKLSNKNSKDKSGNAIDYFSLGLLSLLFFFENMLIRNKKTGVKELAAFLFELCSKEIDLDYNGFEKAARTVIETFRPATGKRNYKEFYNWETREEDSVQYSILKADRADLETNTQYYILDEQGLELIFATKEYYSEFQLSINQLVLRKQLEKGEFVGALRQIDEMSLDVASLHDRIIKIKHEVTRNIVSTETYQRYKTIIEDINLRLNRENEEFEELQSFVTETKEAISNEITNEKDKKAYELIIQIDKSLGEVHFEHRELLKESIVLKTTALNSAQEALYFVGIDSFNFNQEITSRVFSSPLPLNSTRRLIEPFLYLEKHKSWSPLTVFSKQRIENKEKQESTKEFLEYSKEEEIKKDAQIQSENFKIITNLILKSMGKLNKTTLSDVVKYIKENGQSSFLESRVFYAFWIILHQKSPIKIDPNSNEDDMYFGKSLDLIIHKGKILDIKEIEGIVVVTERFSIKNMSFEIGGE